MSFRGYGSFKYWVRATIRDIYKFPSDLWWNLRNYARWMPVLWNCWHFDHSFLWKVLGFQARLMHKHFTKHGHHIGSERDAEELLQVAILCERLSGDTRMAITPFRGSILNHEFVKAKIRGKWVPLDPEQIDLDYLCKLLRKGRNWWD